MSGIRHSLADVRTPDLGRAVADYTQVLGFECRQHIPGVFALVVHGPLQVQLWACGAAPGRWERPTPGDQGFVPAHHRVEVAHIHALHASLRTAVLRPCCTRVGGCAPLHAHRLHGSAPCWQPWGAWELALSDVDGNVLHLVEREPSCPNAPTQGQPDASRPEGRT